MGVPRGLGAPIALLLGISSSKVGTQLQQFVDAYMHRPTRLLGPHESIGTSVATVLAAVIVPLLTRCTRHSS
jgi:hypothetical protein